MCKNAFNEAKFKELDEFIAKQSNVEGALISVLHKAQEIFGYLPQEVQLYVARSLKIPAAKVNGVVTFYSYFSEVPRGEHIINVCMGTACFVRGAEEILKETEDVLGIKAGQTTEDGKFTIDALRCVGACGLAPVVLVDGKVHVKVSKKDVKDLIKQYR